MKLQTSSYWTVARRIGCGVRLSPAASCAEASAGSAAFPVVGTRGFASIAQTENADIAMNSKRYRWNDSQELQSDPADLWRDWPPSLRRWLVPRQQVSCPVTGTRRLRRHGARVQCRVIPRVR